MKQKRWILALLGGLGLYGLLCLAAYAYTIRLDWQAGDLEAFELAARLLGYFLSLLSLALCARAALGLWRKGGPVPMGAMMLAGLASVLLLCAHDLLLYQTYGNTLEGTLSMAAFFALDAGLLALYLLAVALACRRPPRALPLWICLPGLLLWLAYQAGDMAGYPAATLADWDEALMKGCFAFPFLLNLLPGCWGQPAAARPDTRR